MIREFGICTTFLPLSKNFVLHFKGEPAASGSLFVMLRQYCLQAFGIESLDRVISLPREPKAPPANVYVENH